MGAVRALYRSAVRTVPLCFPERTELGRCTGAVQKRSTYSAQGKFQANLSKRPHFDLAPYIYATLTLGQLREFIFRFHTKDIFQREEKFQELIFIYSNTFS